jgi:threonine dehydrogenase-like Zn-dependent dehydrogenase
MPRWDRARRTALVGELLGELPLSELISHRFEFADAASAYELLERSPSECLQVVIDYV